MYLGTWSNVLNTCWENLLLICAQLAFRTFPLRENKVDESRRIEVLGKGQNVGWQEQEEPHIIMFLKLILIEVKIQ